MSDTPKQPQAEYFVAFDSAGKSGYLLGTRIKIDQDVIEAESEYRIDLANDPLYYKLWTYCKNNPPRHRK